MALVQLTAADLTLLEHIAAHSSDARQVRRAEALVWLCYGDTPSEIAERLDVSVQTIYNWVRRFQERCDYSVAHRVADAARSGRQIGRAHV